MVLTSYGSPVLIINLSYFSYFPLAPPIFCFPYPPQKSHDKSVDSSYVPKPSRIKMHPRGDQNHDGASGEPINSRAWL